jgi:type IV pilus assembly protein PilV
MSITFRSNQQGFALIESMVAIVVVALGVLGILGVQLRTLSDTQTGVRRAQAIRLVEDLSERMKTNPNALGNLASYQIGWGTPSSPPDCKTVACNAQNLALSDIRQWKQNVQASLPLSDANVFEVVDETVANNRRQLGVMISWRENERADGTAADNAIYQGVFTPDATGVAGAVCPANRICHLQYIQLTARCTPYLMGGAAAPTVFCPL